jgi:hypothetical protein
MTFYITLLSSASRDLYPNNTIAKFRVRLPRPVELLQVPGNSGCANWPTRHLSQTEIQPIFVYYDLIGLQMVGDTLARSVGTIHFPSLYGYHIFDKVYYVPVGKMEFQTVALEMLSKLGNRVPFPDSTKPLVAVLHFRRCI